MGDRFQDKVHGNSGFIYGDHVHDEASLALFIRFDIASAVHRPCCLLAASANGFRWCLLDGEEYATALGSAAAVGVVGGGIYDAMLAHCALKAQAETIYTWNAQHYAQFGPEVTQRLRTP